MGHICCLNLAEFRVKLENEDILQSGMIIIYIYRHIVGSGET
jgi:hypothetical protein